MMINYFYLKKKNQKTNKKTKNNKKKIQKIFHMKNLGWLEINKYNK